MKETNRTRIELIFSILMDEEPYKINEIFIDYIFSNTRYFFEDDKRYDILDEDDFEYYKEILSEKIYDCDSVQQMFMFVDKRYKMFVFKYVREFLNEKDYAEILKDCWITEEFPSRSNNVSIEEYVEFFENVNLDYFLDDKEKETYNNLDENITIYRGVKTINGNYLRACSWTLDFEQAKWFAKRFDEIEGDAIVYEITINKNEILAYTNERSENEIIINPDILDNLEVKKHII